MDIVSIHGIVSITVLRHASIICSYNAPFRGIVPYLSSFNSGKLDEEALCVSLLLLDTVNVLVLAMLNLQYGVSWIVNRNQAHELSVDII